MPHRKHYHLVSAWDVVEVVTRPLQQDATCPRHRSLPVQPTDLWCVTEGVERGGQFIKEQIWSSSPIPAPPVVDFADLPVCFRSGSDPEAHRRWRSSSRIADAGRR